VVELDELPTTVVGVMPAGFDFPERADLWVPQPLDPNSLGCWCLRGLGRLAPGVSLEEARREIVRMADEEAERAWGPDSTRGSSIAIIQTLSGLITSDVRMPLLVLLGAVGMVLLIMCVNLANLSLARAAGRGRELAVTACLGASTLRVARQLFAENLMVAAIGGAAGIAVARAFLQLFRRLPLDGFPRLDDVRLDGLVIGFGLVITLGSATLFGILPAWRGSRVNLQDALKEGGRGGRSGRSRRLQDAFVVVQIALSLVLLSAAGLLLRSLDRLLSIDPGFAAAHVLTASLSIPAGRYGSEDAALRFHNRLLEEIRALPGVEAAGLTWRAPFAGGNPQKEVVGEGHVFAPDEPIPVANNRYVSTGYFAAIGTPIVRGRSFEDTDDRAHPLVAIVDETLARRYWPDGDALGKRIRFGADPATNAAMTIVGIAKNAKFESLGEVPTFQIYQPMTQATPLSMNIVVRTSGDPQRFASVLRSRVAALDPAVPVYRISTLVQSVGRTLAARRVTNGLILGFAAVALLLATTGVYGVMSIGVTDRADPLVVLRDD